MTKASHFSTANVAMVDPVDWDPEQIQLLQSAQPHATGRKGMTLGWENRDGYGGNKGIPYGSLLIET